MSGEYADSYIKGEYRVEGARIRAARKYADWSQERLADELGVHPTTVWRYEHGQLPDNDKIRERLLLDVGRFTRLGPWVAYGDRIKLPEEVGKEVGA